MTLDTQFQSSHGAVKIVTFHTNSFVGSIFKKKYRFDPETTTTMSAEVSVNVSVWAVLNQRLDRCHYSDECLRRRARHDGLCSSVC